MQKPRIPPHPTTKQEILFLRRMGFPAQKKMKNHIITIKNPACYDLDPYIGKYCEYTSIDESDKPFTYAGHIERDSRGEAMVHDSGEDWVYAYTGVISEIKIYM